MTTKNKKVLTDLLNKDFDLNQYRRDLVEAVLLEVFRIIEAERKAYGEEFSMLVTEQFLASFVSTLVYKSLAYYRDKLPHLGEEDRNKLAVNNYQQMKQLVSEAVSAGFSGGMNLFNPSSFPEYTCEIKLLDPGNDTGKSQ